MLKGIVAPLIHIGESMDQTGVQELLRSVDERDSVLRSHEVASIFKKVRDWFDTVGLKDDADKMHWELEAWSLMPSTARAGVRRTEYIPQFGFEDGSSWPNPKTFSEEQWGYLAERAHVTDNFAVRARYSDLLWFYRKDFQRGLVAVLAYAELETILWDRHERDSDYALGPAWIVSLFRPIELAKQLSRSSELFDARNQVLERIRLVSTNDDVTVNGSIESLFSKTIDFIDVFDGEDRHAIGEALERLLKHMSEDDWFKEPFLKFRLSLHQKTSASSLKEKATYDLAQFHLGRADEVEADSKLLAASQLSEAAKYLESLPASQQDKSQLESIQRRRTDLLSDDTQYATFTHEFAIDLGHVTGYLERYRRTDAPLVFALPAFLISNMLTEDRVHKSLEAHKKAAPVLYAINHMPIWDDGVVEFIPEQEKQLEEYHFWSTAMEALQFVSFHLPHLERSLDTSWNEETIFEILRSAQLIDTARVPYIQDGVSAYFNGSCRAAVRLLTLEMEAIARGVLAKIGLGVTRSNPTKGAGAQKVKDLSECLRTPELCKVLGEPWVLAARALLVEEGGQKLRHRVAHGRSIENVTTREIALVLIGLILWVANFYRSETERSPAPH